MSVGIGVEVYGIVCNKIILELKKRTLFNGYWKPCKTSDDKIIIPVHEKKLAQVRILLTALGFSESERIHTNIIDPHNKFNESVRAESTVEKRFCVVSIEFELSKKVRIKTQNPEHGLSSSIQKLLQTTGLDEGTQNRLMADLPRRWEKHDDLLLLPPDCFVQKQWQIFGESLWQTVAASLSCKRVARKDRISCDKFRTPQVTLLLGDTDWVEQVDNGIRYGYPVTKCMFSAGNISEKLRVAAFSCQGETVVDLYAGIGYFTLPYLVHAGASIVHACEWNSDAILALKYNLQVNGVLDRCVIHKGDNRKFCPYGIADRVNLGLIPSSEAGWPMACAALKSNTGGVLHIHQNVTSASLTKRSTTNSEPVTDDCRIHDGSHTHTNKGLDVCTYDTDHVTTVAMETDDNYVAFSDVTCIGDISQKELSNIECEYDGNNPIGVCTMDSSSTNDMIGVIPDCSSVHNQPSVHNKQCVTGKTYSVKAGKVNMRERVWLQWADMCVSEIKALLQQAHGSVWKVRIMHIEHVKSYAPHVDHLVLDLECRPQLGEVHDITVH